MFFGLLLNLAEDVGYLAGESGEVEVDDGAAGMEDDVDREAEGGEVGADGLAHAALDAVAVYGFAHDLAYGEADSGSGGVNGALGCFRGAEGEKEGHLLAELLAARLIDALVVGVFTEAEDDGGRRRHKKSQGIR